MNTNLFAMTAREHRLLLKLLERFNPQSIAEFGSGGSTRLFATGSTARIVTWDNCAPWHEALKLEHSREPWFHRVEYRLYTVTPEGPRNVEKDPVAWDGPKFDLIFIDGPRSAHEPNPGRSGSFRFAARHIREAGCIVWHDFDRPHEQEMAARYFPEFRIQQHHTIGWCVAERHTHPRFRWFRRRKSTPLSNRTAHVHAAQ